jgi:phenylpropionate dioxygenase-like ring-hydroxylating dioxygenase large terminal subunit
MFLAHKNSITLNSYTPLPQFQNKSVLINDGEFKTVSNVCPHQKSLISTSDGVGNRVCPYHSWSFNISGIPIASGRTGKYCKNENSLGTYPVYEWNGLLFSTPVNFDLDINFKDMQLVEKRIDKVHTRYENIIDLFLDVDHIPGVHTGVYDKIGISNIESVRWKYFNNGNVQYVYNEQGELGAAWVTVYPNTMIEWQPGALFITVALKKSLSETDVLVFKYRDAKSDDALWQLNEDIWETAWQQDKDQAEIITEFNQENLEESKIHFRNWLKYGIN